MMRSRRKRGTLQNGPRLNSSTQEELHLLRVGEPAHGGACVARDEGGRVIFVRHALPGELVRAQVSRVRSNLAWADAVEVLEASPDRVVSPWPSAGPGGVGGAELAHVAPRAQREWKSHVLRGQFRRIGGTALAEALEAIGGVAVRPAVGDEDPADPLLGRRLRIEWVIDDLGRPAMYRHHDRTLIPITDMPLADERIGQMGVFEPDSVWRGLWKAGDRVRALAPTGDQPAVLVGSQLYDASGKPRMDQRLTWDVNLSDQRLTYGVRPTGFWQTHRTGASVLAENVRSLSALSGGERVLELYSGAGLFSAVLGQDVGTKGRILTLEGDEGAVADAADNVRDLPSVHTRVGAVDASAVRELATAFDATADLVVLDPPRSGAGNAVCQAIVDLGAPRIILVSCDPAAGARDVAAFMRSGYRLDVLHAWDLFPHTHHVETVAVLSQT